MLCQIHLTFVVSRKTPDSWILVLSLHPTGHCAMGLIHENVSALFTQL